MRTYLTPPRDQNFLPTNQTRPLEQKELSLGIPTIGEPARIENIVSHPPTPGHLLQIRGENDEPQHLQQMLTLTPYPPAGTQGALSLQTAFGVFPAPEKKNGYRTLAQNGSPPPSLELGYPPHVLHQCRRISGLIVVPGKHFHHIPIYHAGQG